MVSFKKLFLATSLLLSAVAADSAPAADRTLNVATAELRAVNDFAIEARNVNNEKRFAQQPKQAKQQAKQQPKPAPPPPKKKNCRRTKRDSLASKVLNAGHDANSVKETEYVDAMQIKNNGGHATVTDLSGCTALFFYMGNTLRRAVHVTCGNEEADAKTATQAAAGADSVTIGASSKAFHDNAVKGIHAASKNMKINGDKQYSMSAVNDNTAVTLKASDGSHDWVPGTGTRICKQA